MEKKLTSYSLLAIDFVSGMIQDNKDSKEQLENTILDTQNFILDLMYEVVNEFEPNEEFEQASLSMKIAEALYVPIIMYKRNESLKQAEQTVKNELNEVIENYRNERENNKNSRDYGEDF